MIRVPGNRFSPHADQRRTVERTAEESACHRVRLTYTITVDTKPASGLYPDKLNAGHGPLGNQPEYSVMVAACAIALTLMGTGGLIHGAQLPGR